ncbi:hypothetical protein D3C80_585430 [compost metagenome]
MKAVEELAIEEGDTDRRQEEGQPEDERSDKTHRCDLADYEGQKVDGNIGPGDVPVDLVELRHHRALDAAGEKPEPYIVVGIIGHRRKAYRKDRDQ